MAIRNAPARSGPTWLPPSPQLLVSGCAGAARDVGQDAFGSQRALQALTPTAAPGGRGRACHPVPHPGAPGAAVVDVQTEGGGVARGVALGPVVEILIGRERVARIASLDVHAKPRLAHQGVSTQQTMNAAPLSSRRSGSQGAVAIWEVIGRVDDLPIAAQGPDDERPGQRSAGTTLSVQPQLGLLGVEHDFDVDAVVVGGEMWLGCQGRTEHLRTGDRFTLARNVPHDERYGAEGAVYWVARRNARA